MFLQLETIQVLWKNPKNSSYHWYYNIVKSILQIHTLDSYIYYYDQIKNCTANKFMHWTFGSFPLVSVLLRTRNMHINNCIQMIKMPMNYQLQINKSRCFISLHSFSSFTNRAILTLFVMKLTYTLVVGFFVFHTGTMLCVRNILAIVTKSHKEIKKLLELATSQFNLELTVYVRHHRKNNYMI